jgi:hypothetical protein
VATGVGVEVPLVLGVEVDVPLVLGVDVEVVELSLPPSDDPLDEVVTTPVDAAESVGMAALATEAAPGATEAGLLEPPPPPQPARARTRLSRRPRRPISCFFIPTI